MKIIRRFRIREKHVMNSFKRICDENGQFRCEGRFDQDNCKYGGLVNSENESGDSTMVHFINPYESSEARILFSTWNLDHV